MRALTSTRTYSPFRLRLPAPTVAACRHHSRLANVHLHPTLQALRFACASVQHTAGLAPSGAATASRASAKYSHTLRRACRRMAAPSLVAPTALSAPGNRPRSGSRRCSLTPARKRLQGVSSWSQTPPSSPSLPPHPRPLFMKTCALLKTPFPSHLLRCRDSLRFGASLTLTFPNNNSLGQVKLALCLEYSRRTVGLTDSADLGQYGLRFVV